MITNMNSIISRGWDKVFVKKKLQKRTDDDCQYDFKDKDNGNGSDNGIYRII